MPRALRPTDRTRPRKVARQERAKVTVGALLEATGIVIVKVGYARATTNRIAEVAGVNIASLYQYFPSKEALVAALIDRHFEEVFLRVGAELAPSSEVRGRDVARALVRSYFELFQNAPELHAALHRCTHAVRRVEALEDARVVVVKRVAAMLDAVASELRVDDRELAAFTVVHAVEALAIAAFTHRTEDLRSGRAAESATEVVVRYLFDL